MPVEIRELEITVAVEGPCENAQPNAPTRTDQDKIIAECVEQVIKILEQKNER